jgi:hypothetical protein
MKRFLLFLPLMLLLFSCCKSNEKAYNATYQKLKDKNEESLLAERAQTAETITDDVVKKNDPGVVKVHEVVTVVLGEDKNLSTYNIVIKSFINRTNARSLYNRMIEEGRNAVLVQNKDMMYRIVVDACKYEIDADKLLTAEKKTWPEAWILVRY